MKFSIDDLNEFRFTESNEVICDTTFVKPIHIVLASNAELYGKRNFRFKYKPPLDYAKNMKYDNPLSIDTIDGLNHSKAIKLRDTFEDDNQVEKVMNILRHNNYLNDETIATFQVVIAEIFQNFYAHAEYDKPPICCVQDWANTKYLEIAIADKGIGLDQSLKDVLKDYPEDINPCQIACESGISSKLHQKGKLGTSHSGYGLFFTKRFIEENNGRLFLMSGNYCYENNCGKEQNHRLKYYNWVGTAIRLIINKSCTINSELFYKKMVKEQEGGNYDEYF